MPYFDDFLSLFESVGGLFSDALAFVLLLLPAAAFLVFFLLRIFWRRIRCLPRAWYPLFCDICLLIFLALFLTGGNREQIYLVAALVFAEKAATILLYGLLFIPFPRKKSKLPGKKRKQKFAAKMAEECVEIPAAPIDQDVPARPPMVRCFAGAEPVRIEKDVRLDHIYSVLERLKEMPLRPGDRLEAQKTGEMLDVYRAKGELSAEEADTLNDILASLLKMMAKYDM